MQRQVVIGLSAVVVAVTDGQARVLTVAPTDDVAASGALGALPSGLFDPAGDRTIELGLRRYVREQTGFEVGYAEQLYTFGDRFRHPEESKGGPRVVSVGYLALTRQSELGMGSWRDWYRYFPWEDWRDGQPPVLREIGTALRAWVDAADPQTRTLRRERCELTFPESPKRWNAEATLERYELLYGLGLVAESGASGTAFGVPLALDHRRILATAIGRLRGKIKYRPVVFELVAQTFTLLELQQTVEALAGVRLHKQNFRRLVEHGGFVERTGKREAKTGGRPAELFRFRRQVVRERIAPGVGVPRLRTAEGG